MGVFETFFGLPLHPLVIHAAVVFIPLLIIGAVVYALLPRWRARTDWAVVLLAVIAPLSALLAKLSGDAFRARLARLHEGSPQLLDRIDEHRHFGTVTLYVTIALGVVTLVAALVPRVWEKATTAIPLVVVIVVLAIATGYYVFRTGDTAAHIVWQGF
jgi:hypothetical protein